MGPTHRQTYEGPTHRQMRGPDEQLPGGGGGTE